MMLTKDERDAYARHTIKSIVDAACAADGHPVVVLNECACGKRAKAKVRRVVTNRNDLKAQLDYVLPYRD